MNNIDPCADFIYFLRKIFKRQISLIKHVNVEERIGLVKLDCDTGETFQSGAAVPVPSPVRHPSSNINT